MLTHHLYRCEHPVSTEVVVTDPLKPQSVIPASRAALARRRRPRGAGGAMAVAGGGGEWGGGADFGDAAAVQDDDAVGTAHGGEPVGDDEGGASLEQPLEGA